MPATPAADTCAGGDIRSSREVDVAVKLPDDVTRVMEPPGTVGVDGWFSAIIFCRTSRILSWRQDLVGKTFGCLAINCAVACAVDKQAIDIQGRLSWHMSLH